LDCVNGNAKYLSNSSSNSCISFCYCIIKFSKNDFELVVSDITSFEFKVCDSAYWVIWEWSQLIAVSHWVSKGKVSNFELGLRIVEIVVKVSKIFQ